MDTPDQNPLTQHFMGILEGRQAQEHAKISTMAQIVTALIEVRDLLKCIDERLDEQNERAQGRG